MRRREYLPARLPRKGDTLSCRAMADAGERKNVIKQHEQQGEDQARTLSASPRGDSERHANQQENQAGCWIGKARLQFENESLSVRLVRALQQRIHRQGIDGGIQASQVQSALRAQRQRQICLGKR